MLAIAQNKKAWFDYEVLETLEAGIVLLGSEVKALRKARVNLKDNFVKIIRNEAFLFGVHISYLDTTHPHYRPDERRERKLLLHRKQIDRLFGKVGMEGLSIVALKLYFNQKNKAKVQIALVKGKNLHDKRESIKKRILDREAQASVKNFYKGER
ncbi:SsrA-binding protein [Helicobacter sp. 12S02634-8]|uniref:SsrA-binding protein SmpB n=1 Tax=Helicobacter sp. 12S02634-8 TaxID=1476199 RepID=UPI000BA74B4B|nr:SsrA-binding protein SmpB [Helicobacter sp. 12S02634-8]PAF48022.1 SsrA-binding protein [Helicobacter sp. 12S02634-8]